jgi:hypothetical protein
MRGRIIILSLLLEILIFIKHSYRNKEMPKIGLFVCNFLIVFVAISKIVVDFIDKFLVGFFEVVFLEILNLSKDLEQFEVILLVFID